jgi:GH15 family glucan-1,4-alpha-glucosidase
MPPIILKRNQQVTGIRRESVKKLIQTSKKVIQDSSLENGAIIAANADKSIYPPAVQDYRYVWIRDASYICISADLLGLRQIPERFFDWCLNRAEGFKDTGLFYNAYSVNGAVNGTLIRPADLKTPLKVKNRYIYTTHHGIQFQPDQNGSLLLAIGHHVKHFAIGDISKFKKLIENTASGISNSWKNKKFTLPCFDLWEERCILPSQKRYYTYSLAMCIAGLRTAIELLGKNKNWLRTEKEMSSIFDDIYSHDANHIPRTYTAGKLAERREIRKDDFLPDTSLLGLVYPSAILDPFDSKMKETVDEIIEKNTIANGGLLRYPKDTYCGGVQKGYVTSTGAGAWPLLNFWMSIYFCLRNDRKNAEKYFRWPLTKVNEYIPEQIFKNKIKPSVCPLVWSHSMFIIAAKFLGHI